MNTHIYPGDKFLSKIKYETQEGNDFNVEIIKSKRGSFITEKIIKLLVDGKSEEKKLEIYCVHDFQCKFFLRLFLRNIRKLHSEKNI